MHDPAPFAAAPVRTHPAPLERRLRREMGITAVASVGLVALLQLVQTVAVILTGLPYSRALFVRDTLAKVGWGVSVCVVLWLALALGRERPRVVAAVGLLAAPLCSLFSHALTVAANAYTFAAGPTSIPAPFLVAAVRGAEYAALAFVVARLAMRAGARPTHFAAVGLAIGAVFSSILLLATHRFSAVPVTAATLIGWVVGDLLFPAGCALILRGATAT